MTEIVGQIPVAQSKQWIIEDSEQWTPEEIEIVVAPIRDRMQWLYAEYGIVANNYWQIYKVGNSFTARKRSWEYSICRGSTPEECAAAIKEYIKKNK